MDRRSVCLSTYTAETLPSHITTATRLSAVSCSAALSSGCAAAASNVATLATPDSPAMIGPMPSDPAASISTVGPTASSRPTVVEFKSYVLLGVIGNAQPADNSYSDPTCFGWSSDKQVFIAGRNTNGHGGWAGWQAGDVAVFKLEAQRLSMRVRRLGDRTFTMDTNGAQNLRIHVYLTKQPTRVQLSRAEPQDEF
eukprot:COSAG06_NODE_7867_length_2347_cov_25.032918_2_plen_196_part_00